MKALTIRNPWAYLIAWGIKDIENRTIKTKKIDERIYIHTSLTWAGKSRMDWDLLSKEQKNRLSRNQELYLIEGKENFQNLLPIKRRELSKTFEKYIF